MPPTNPSECLIDGVQQMNEIIERVARALWGARRAYASREGIFLEEWGDGAVPRANGVFEEARAAIEAIREPTDDMMVEAEMKVPALLCFAEKEKSPSYKAWQTMIDAALNDEGAR